MQRKNSEMDDIVDMLYRKYLQEIVVTSSPRPKGTEGGYADNYNNINDKNSKHQPRCYISSLLILRYLKRISDHACYIGDSVHYIALDAENLILYIRTTTYVDLFSITESFVDFSV
jgi:phosphate transport system protein